LLLAALKLHVAGRSGGFSAGLSRQFFTPDDGQTVHPARTRTRQDKGKQIKVTGKGRTRTRTKTKDKDGK